MADQQWRSVPQIKREDYFFSFIWIIFFSTRLEEAEGRRAKGEGEHPCDCLWLGLLDMPTCPWKFWEVLWLLPENRAPWGELQMWVLPPILDREGGDSGMSCILARCLTFLYSRSTPHTLLTHYLSCPYESILETVSKSEVMNLLSP